jgi:hypothetical protein
LTKIRGRRLDRKKGTGSGRSSQVIALEEIGGRCLDRKKGTGSGRNNQAALLTRLAAGACPLFGFETPNRADPSAYLRNLVYREETAMITTYMYAPGRVLIEGCLQPHEEAWWAFYERFGSLLQGKVRRALGSWAADANVVDEVIQDVRVYIYEGSIALAAYEERPERLEEFLEECVGICARRYLARRTRRKHHEVQAGDEQLEQLIAEAEVLDEVTIQEFRQLLAIASSRPDTPLPRITNGTY